jgi:hypothetical protein
LHPGNENRWRHNSYLLKMFFFVKTKRFILWVLKANPRKTWSADIWQSTKIVALWSHGRHFFSPLAILQVLDVGSCTACQ